MKSMEMAGASRSDQKEEEYLNSVKSGETPTGQNNESFAIGIRKRSVSDSLPTSNAERPKLQCSECHSFLNVEVINRPESDYLKETVTTCPGCKRVLIQTVMEVTQEKPRVRGVKRTRVLDESLTHFGNYIVSTLREMSPERNRDKQKDIVNALLAREK